MLDMCKAIKYTEERLLNFVYHKVIDHMEDKFCNGDDLYTYITVQIVLT